MPALFDLRRSWLLVLTVAAAAAGVVAGFSFTAAKRYRATAVVVVSPVPATDPTFVGVDVLHDTTRATAAATAARLLRTPEVADAVRVKLGLHESSQSLLDKVSTRVVGRSDAVAVTATDTEPARAAQIANGFVDAFVSARSSTFQSEIASAIARVGQRLVELTPAQRASQIGVTLQRRLADLRTQLGTPDPTVRHGSEAVQPTKASWPHPIRWTIYAALAGLGAGLLLALLLALPAWLRRREAGPGTVLEGRLSDRAADRVAERVERRLAARLDRLAAAQAPAAAAAAPAPDPERVAELERRERELAERLEDVGRRERALEQRVGERSDAEAARAERAEALDARERELRAQSEQLDRHERALKRRAGELEQLERRLDGERRTLEERGQELEQRAGELARREEQPPELSEPPPAPALAPAPEPAAPPSPAPAAPAPEPAAAPPAPVPGRGWSLDELERLVERHADEFPHRAEEWRSYLFYLRDYVDSEGRVPSQFDWLVEDTFGELLAAR